MKEIEANIPVNWKNKTVGPVHLKGDQTAAGSYRLFCMFMEKPYYGEGSDYFEALQQLRQRLERNQIELLCAGSKREVWPSAMSRQMGGGLKAYICNMGHQSKEIVNIFEADELMQYCSVEEQAEYHKNWFESLGT